MESGEDMLRINPQRAAQLLENVAAVSQRIKSASQKSAHGGKKNVRLVAVSKLKPATDILALHRPSESESQPQQEPQLHFGENYLQELQEKAALLPRSVRWHFIGGLQTNKCRPLAESIPNLWCVESVDSAKKADALEKGRAALAEKLQGAEPAQRDGLEDRLRVMVQVNTSGEESKSGVEPGDALDLCRHVSERCPHLKLQGLMTIGAIARSKDTTPETENDDFVALRDTRDTVAEGLGMDKELLELSMGMSSDYEGAIAMGSDEVRVGSTIFGERPPKKDAKVVEDVKEEKG